MGRCGDRGDIGLIVGVWDAVAQVVAWAALLEVMACWSHVSA